MNTDNVEGEWVHKVRISIKEYECTVKLGRVRGLQKMGK